MWAARFPCICSKAPIDQELWTMRNTGGWENGRVVKAKSALSHLETAPRVALIPMLILSFLAHSYSNKVES